MNRKIIGVATIAIVLTGAWCWQRSIGAENIQSSLFGNVDIRDVNVSFRVAGRVSQVKVDEGTAVKEGDALATLDIAPLKNTIHSLEATLASVSARNALLHQGYRREDIDLAKAKLVAARAALTETQTQLVRETALVPAGAVPQRELDAAQSARDQAAAQLASAEAQLRLTTTGYRKEEIAESDALVQQARANLDTARLALADATLVAPSDGIVLTRAVEKGTMVQVGSTAFDLSLTQPVWVRAYVPESQLGQYANGQAVLLSTDSRANKPYHGVVGFVSPTAEFTPKSVETTDLRTTLVYRIRVVVSDPDAQLRQGMPVTVRRAS